MDGNRFDIPLGALQSENIENLYVAAVQSIYGKADIEKIRAELERQKALV